MREPRILLQREIDAIFKRFPEGHPYYIPLRLIYECGMCPEEAFGVTAKDFGITAKNSYGLHSYWVKSAIFVYYDRKTHKTRILHKRANSKFCETYYISADLYRVMKKYALLHPDWKPQSPQAINYISRVIRGKTSHIDYVDEYWQWQDLISPLAPPRKDWATYNACVKWLREKAREKYSS